MVALSSAMTSSTEQRINNALEKNVCLFIPLYSSLFLFIPLYPSLFLFIPLYSSLFPFSPLYSSLFLFIPLYSSLFLFIPLYSSLFLFISLYSSLFLFIPSFPNIDICQDGGLVPAGGTYVGDTIVYKWVLSKTTLAQTGQYQCNMTYGAYGTFKGGTLVGDIANIIMVGIKTLSTSTWAIENQEVKLSCSIEGDGMATNIKWYKNGTTDTKMADSLVSMEYIKNLKQSVSTLTFAKDSTTSANSGFYYCKGLYSAGYVTSDKIELKVLKVGIETQPADAKVETGKEAKFTCKASSTVGFVPAITWYKTGSATVIEGVTTDTTDSKTSVLTRSKINAASIGM